MKQLMHEIKKIMAPEIEHFEIEHLEDETYFIDVRLYGENTETAEKIAAKINKFDTVLNADVYTPHPDTVRFGFSGYEFTGISVEVSLKDMTELNEDYLIMDDNEPII